LTRGRACGRMRGVASASEGAREAQKGWCCVSENGVCLDECCGACRYFKELVREIHTRDVLDGERVYKTVTTVCRRHPASVGKASDEWCGEFARRGRGGVAGGSGGGERATEPDAAPGAVPELDTAPAPAPAPATEVRTVVLSEALGRVLAALRDMSGSQYDVNGRATGRVLWYNPVQDLLWDDIHAVVREAEAAGVLAGGFAVGGDAKGGAA
jgi:hypothetical protein